MRDDPDRCLVLVTGFAAAGKSTLAPRIASELGALRLSRDSIHEMVYSGWEPRHPALFQETYDPHVGGSTFREGQVVWNVFLWMLQRVTTKTAVVADTPFNHEWNRAMFNDAATSITVPKVEVALHGAPDALLERARRRAASGAVHPIKAKFSLDPDRYHAGEYQPVLPEHQVVDVDTTDLDNVNPVQIAHAIRQRLRQTAH